MTALTLLAPCEFSGFDGNRPGGYSGAVSQAVDPWLFPGRVSAFPLARGRPAMNALT